MHGKSIVGYHFAVASVLKIYSNQKIKENGLK
jgi:hypothetical protein